MCIRDRYSVVPFDEIEKAHPDVFNVFLQVLDDGRLTDGQGRTVDFRNTLVIMTSIGSHIIQEHFLNGKTDGATDRLGMEQKVEAELKVHFRPEFLNRIDDTIVFHSLEEEQLAVITDIQLKSVAKRLEAQQLTLEVSNEAKRHLAREGYDPQFGSRPLKRTIQEQLLNPLATRLLNGEFKPGEHIRVGLANDELTFEV